MITDLDAMQAVAKFEAMAYFGQVGEAARSAIADSLMRLVNPKDPKRDVPCKYPAEDRLRLFVEAFMRMPNGWPGIGEMEAIYCMMFPPGDGIERDSPTTPGYTFEDNQAGTHVPLLPVAPEPEYKLLPGDRLTDEERRQMASEFAGALVKLSGEHCNVGVTE